MRPLLQKAWLVLRTALLINAGFLALLLIGLALLAFTPIYKLAERERAPDEWELKTKSMSDEELLARLEEAVKLGTADGTYWNTLKTAEEQYPGRYSPDNPPPYWNEIVQDFELGRALGLVQSESLPPYDSLTRRERLLLCYFDEYESARDRIDELRSVFGTLFLGEDGFISDFVRRRSALRYGGLLPEEFLASGKGLDTERARSWLSKWGTHFCVSPVSGSLMCSNLADFAPGQAYTECYFLDSGWERLLLPYMQWTTEYSPQECRDHGLMYYRVYGEKGVIAEGVRALPKAGRYYRVVRESIKQGLGE